MPRKSVPLLLTALLAAPLPVFALGLGEIALNSSLNEPLNARINLDSVQPGDLTNFKATVASGDTFSRYGLDRPDFLNTLRFEIDVDTGRPLLLVTSTSAITEPFVTFLVEANWDSGRLLREYTVLLDPPVFNPQSAAAPVRAPQTAGSQLDSSSGFVPRPTPVPAPAPAPRRPVAVANPGESYGPVQRNETLWAIADRARAGTGLSINQMMIAIYDANPAAFLGNINLLKEGSTLALPGSNLAAQISRQDAFTRARDHNQRWRAGGTVARSAPSTRLAATEPDDSRRLKLVAPEGGSTDAGLSALQQQLEEEQARNTELSEQIDGLRSEIADSERLVNLRNSGLADVQASLAEQQAQEAAQRDAVDASQTEFEPVDEGVDALPATDPTQIADVDGDGSPGPDGTPPVDTPPDTTQEPAPVTTPTTVATAPAPIQSAPSLVDRIIGAWPIALGALALLGGLLFWRSRSSDEPAEDESWEALSRDSDIPMTEAAATSTIAVTEGSMADEDVEYFEDTGTFKPIDFTEAEADVGLEREAQNADAPAPAVDFPFEDTLAGDESLKLDQSDPLAEADFHIAYGLYDQAADLVRAASEREPERRDLKMKLLEIFFVWGNKDSFLSSAASLRSDVGDGPNRDWDKVVIMGRQICPGDELFTGDGIAATADMIDLQLDETGETPIDLNTETLATDQPMDFDLGEALDASTDATGTVDNVIDFDFSGSATDMADASSDNDTVAQKIDALGSESDDTEEIALSDVGIDIDFGDSDAIDESLASSSLDSGATGQAEVLDIDIGEDFDELFGGLDDAAGEPAASGSDDDATDHARSLADVVAAEEEVHDKLLDTSELKVEMEELLASAAGMGAYDDEDAPDDVFKPAERTGSFSAEIQSLANDSVDVDIDFGAADDDDATELMEGISLDDTQEGQLSETFSENVFGSDDATVLASALPDPAAGGGFGDDEFGEIFADDSDSGTAVLKVEDQDFSGDNDATVLAQMPTDARDAMEASSDSLTFEGVFDSANNDDTQENAVDLGDDDFSAAVFGESAGSGDSESTQESAGIDLDVGEAMFDPEPGSGDNTTVKVAAQELALPDIDEGGSSEVGTKLDLARAYMEMGDPDGARGILQEVIDEGDDGQKQDARALLDALP